MSSAADVWRFARSGVLITNWCWRRSATCSYDTARRTIFGQTMGRSLRHKRSGPGSASSVSKRCLSSQAVPGRTVTTRASTESFGTSCSMVRSFTRSGRHRYWWSDGGDITTRCGLIAPWATNHRHHKPGNQMPIGLCRPQNHGQTLWFSNSTVGVGLGGRSNAAGHDPAPFPTPAPARW